MSKKEIKVEQLNEQLEEAKRQTSLAEKQFNGLQETNQRLIEEGDVMKKRYDEIEGRILQEKEKFVELMNKMNTENEELKKKIEMLTKLNQQEKKRFMWSAGKKQSDENVNLAEEGLQSGNRKFGETGVVIPTTVSHSIGAHQRQITCVG